jgi:hypothetical protein
MRSSRRCAIVGAGALAALAWLAAPSALACAKEWDVGAAISVTITAPSNNSVVAGGSNVSCSATASDSDHWVQGGNSGNEADGIASYTWTATAGTFPFGNSGSSVTWKAPNTTGAVTLTCTVNDVGVVYPPDTGTRDDSPGSANVGVTVFNITQSNKIWWFDDVSPQNPQGYTRDATLTAEGSTTGTFQWEVTSGFEDAGFVDGESIVASRTLINSNTVILRAKDESAAVYSVKIKFTYNGIVILDTWNTTVRTAKSLEPLWDDRGLDAVYVYKTDIHYQVIDNVGDVFPATDIGVNEEWTTGVVEDFQGMDWRRGNEGGAAVNPTDWWDGIQGETPGHNPEPLEPDDEGAGTPVYHWGQRWRVGSVVPVVGVRVQTNTLQKYRGYADHLDIGP